MHPTAPKMKRAYATVATGQVHYYDAGGDGPVLMMLHQSPSSSLDYAPTFAGFAAAGIRVLAMDTPGMGMSDGPEEAPTIMDFVGVIPAVLDHAGVARASVLGHHTGVQMAVEAMVSYPDRFDKGVLYGVPAMSAEERQGFWDRSVPRQKEGLLHRGGDDGSHLSAHYERLRSFFSAAFAQRMFVGALMAGPNGWHGHNAALTHDVALTIPKVLQPLLIVTNPGEMFDVHADRMARAARNARVVRLETESSFVLDDDPQGFVDAVAGFVTAG